MEDTSLEFGKMLEAHTSTIPGLVYYDIPVHGDNRGWFKENWQREKMMAVGLPDFQPVQNNISYNNTRGATRGIHAEPWDKFISIASGRIFGAWIDLREGESFGKKFTLEMNPSRAIFVPRGVGNSYQALEDNTVYTYLVNDHWSIDAQSQYTFLNLDDKTSAIEWPIPLSEAEISDKDRNHPFLEAVIPMQPKKILVTGANGQLGKALCIEFPDAEFVTREEIDITGDDLETARNWRSYSAIINAAAYTAVDLAETQAGRRDAWKTNVEAIARLGRVTTKFGLTLVNISSDYVFDGQSTSHEENEAFSPLGIYGQTKAAGDAIVSTLARHYTLRTSWVVGEGKNFVKIMQSLAEKDIKPTVVNDQFGRVTFTQDIAKAIKHLIDTNAPYGTYNISNDGPVVSWSDIAKKVYELSGKDPSSVTPISTAEYYAGKEDIAPRPTHSELSLEKIKSTGFSPEDWQSALVKYLEK